MSPEIPGSLEAPINVELNMLDWKHGFGKGLGIFRMPNRDMEEVDFVMAFPGVKPLS